MTDNEIIKALEYCSTDVRENTCPKCAFYKKHRCSTLMLNAVSDLINRLKMKNKELDEKNIIYRGTVEWQAKELNRQKAENERLKKEVEDKERAYNDEFCLRKEWQTKCREVLKEKQTTKSEAIKEFAERNIASSVVLGQKKKLGTLVSRLSKTTQPRKAVRGDG